MLRWRGVSLAKVCKKKDVDIAAIEQELIDANNPKPQYDYDKWKPDFLINHIVHMHHAYVTEVI